MPGPGSWQVEGESAGVVGEAGSDVEESVAEPFRPQRASSVFGSSSRCVQSRRSWARRTSSSQAAFIWKAWKGRFLQAGVFGAADAVFAGGALAVQLFEAVDPGALLVGEEDLEAVAVVIGEGELRARVGALAAADRPRPGRPTGEVELELADPGARAALAVGVERWSPRPLGHRQNRVSNRLGQVEPDRKTEAVVGDMPAELVRGAAAVAADEQTQRLRVVRCWASAPSKTAM